MKDPVNLSKWKKEDFKREYDLIKQKVSKLPASQRKIVVEVIDKNLEIKNV